MAPTAAHDCTHYYQYKVSLTRPLASKWNSYRANTMRLLAKSAAVMRSDFQICVIKQIARNHRYKKKEIEAKMKQRR